MKVGHCVLDLGCGTGKQTIPLAQLVGREGRIVAADISQPALDQVLSQAKSLRLDDRIDLLLTELDDIGTHIDGKLFDRVLSCYALYYARDPHEVLSCAHRALKVHGILFFCGPAHGNNAELKRFYCALGGEKPQLETAASVFMSEIGPQLARQLFSSVRVCAFENVLSFDSPESLYRYWSSYNLYNQNVDSKFKRAASKYYEDHQVFETRKRVIGIQAMK